MTSQSNFICRWQLEFMIRVIYLTIQDGHCEISWYWHRINGISFIISHREICYWLVSNKAFFHPWQFAFIMYLKLNFLEIWKKIYIYVKGKKKKDITSKNIKILLVLWGSAGVCHVTIYFLIQFVQQHWINDRGHTVSVISLELSQPSAKQLCL